MGHCFYFNWEVDFIVFIQRFMNDFTTSFASFISSFGEQIAMIAIVGFFYWCFDKKIGKRLAIGISFTNICYPLIKNIFLRNRPYVDSKLIECKKVVSPEHDIYDLDKQGYSFPSGHSANAMFTYGSLFKEYKNTIFRIILSLLVLFVGLSRSALGCHYPTDVLVGWLIGLLVIILVDKIDSKKNRNIYYLVLLVLGAVGFFYCTSTDYYTGYGMLFGCVFANMFEEKYVNFKSTKNILEIIVRMVGGIAIFFGIEVLLKAPFSTVFLESNTFLAYLVRTIRYAIIMFVELGVYPLCFKYIHFNKKK